jgi:hypothetical protein
MSKEFSSLQKQILRLVLKEKFVTSGEILSELWGWKGKEIGKAQYASGHSSLSRTLTKLWTKNLIRYWKGLTGFKTGITLTPEGKTIAQAILADADNEQ